MNEAIVCYRCNNTGKEIVEGVVSDCPICLGPPLLSTSDERTVNNVMRHEYRVLTDIEKAHMKEFKDAGKELYCMCDDIGSSRELSLAKTKIEEAVMWAVKHITK